jgi:hypothetical protein
VSAIHAISRGPVPKSGAGTSMPGPMKFLVLSSKVKRRVIRSSSCSEYLWAAILTPPLAPPKGTLTMAHL